MIEPTRIHLGQGYVPAGTRLSGIYEIDSPLAKGGMGEVYRGHTIETGDPVAIKLIRADMADNEAVLAMFRREASALSRLHHEAIIRYFVFSLDPVLQRHYLAMELVEGEMLSSIAARGPLDAEAALRLLRRLASGLQAAHERGIIHRDLSPDNVIIEGGQLERARIIDFGIARSTRIGDATVIGSGFAGKYNYVSPEQLGLFGGEVTGRSDIYSLGLVMAQCLLGRALDMGGSQVDVVEKRRRVPDLSGVDARLRPLLDRMLQPDPKDRPASMAEVAAWQMPETTSTRRASARVAARRDREGGSGAWKALAAVVGLALLAGGGTVAYLQFADDFAPVRPGSNPSIDRPSLSTAQGSGPSPSGAGQPTDRPGDAGAGSTIAMTAPPPLVPPAGGGSAGLSVDPPVPPVKPGAADPASRIATFIRDYDGGDCFLALPTAVTDTSADIDAFGMNRKVFEDLDAAFVKAQGFEASIEGGQVAQGQCAVLRFVNDLRRSGGAAAGKLEIARTAVRSGEMQSGSLVTDRAVAALLVVDDEGRISDVSQQLAPASSGRRFNVRLNASRPGRVQPVILLALTSAQPLRTLSGGASLTPTAFAGLVREAAGQGGEVAVAAKYFKLE